MRAGDRVVPPEALEVGDQEPGEFVRIGGEARKRPRRSAIWRSACEVPANIVGRHLVDDDGAAVLLAGGRLDVGEAHAVVAVRLGVDGALPAMGIGDRRRQPLGRLQIDDQPVVVEDPVGVAADRDRDIVEPDLDAALRGGRHTVASQLGESVGHVAGKIGALAVAPVIGVERHLAVEGGFGGGDAVLDRQRRVHQPEMDAVLDGGATDGGGAGRSAKVQKSLHHPVRRLVDEVVERARRQPADAVALEGIHAAAPSMRCRTAITLVSSLTSPAETRSNRLVSAIALR